MNSCIYADRIENYLPTCHYSTSVGNAVAAMDACARACLCAWGTCAARHPSRVDETYRRCGPRPRRYTYRLRGAVGTAVLVGRSLRDTSIPSRVEPVKVVVTPLRRVNVVVVRLRREAIPARRKRRATGRGRRDSRDARDNCCEKSVIGKHIAGHS